MIRRKEEIIMLVHMKKIQRLCVQNKITWTEHCLNRLSQRNITINQVKEAIIRGEIVEYYENDYPYPSCLVSGKTKEKIELHIVCGVSLDRVYFITAYYPDRLKWEDDNRTRRKRDGMF